jgi:16S rRNA (guanine966-N2)-methyltransferase
MGRITILGGEAKGRPLCDVRGPETRIATAMLRTSLFDILRPRIEGSRLLDLFAGIGSFGLEGLSRGADFCAFVEENARCVRALRQNVAALGFESRARVARFDAFEVTEGGPFDIVFIDPPYRYFEEPRHRSRLAELLGALAPRAIIRPGSRVVLKHGRGRGLSARECGLSPADVRRYGETELSFYHV